MGRWPACCSRRKRHQLHQIADMHGFGGAVEADIGGDTLLGEQRIQFGRRRAVVIGPARSEGAQEFGLEVAARQAWYRLVMQEACGQ